VDKLSYGAVTQAWSGNYGYGGFYDNAHSGAGLYNSYNFAGNNSHGSGMGYWGW
jgi:hypothetical protein